METNQKFGHSPEISKAFAAAYEIADQSFQATREALILALGERDAVDFMNKYLTDEFSTYYNGIADAHREAVSVEMESKLAKLCPEPGEEQKN